jgi:release factor glutamine methyltransferase
MTLSQLKLTYIDRLKTLYRKEEIESVFSIIAQHVLNYSKIDIHLNKDQKIQASEEKKMKLILTRLISGEPIQYILGETEFFGLPIQVDRRVLIPRSETEYMIELALKSLPQDKTSKIIDICTGSGCIAIALGKNLPLAEITGIDISSDALKLAVHNSTLNKVDIQFFEDDLFNPVINYELFDLIICNPPYVRESEKLLMHKNVLQYEPPSALFVPDSDPLKYYRALAEFGIKYLTPNGMVLVEINENLGPDTIDLFHEYDFNKISLIKDINNKDRFVKAMKNE